MTEKPLGPDALLVDAVRAIEATPRRIAVVVNARGALLGTLTDGDVRRCLLSGGSLDTPVARAMNPQPITAEESSSTAYILDLLRRGNVLALPIVDDAGRFVRLVHVRDLRQDGGVGGGAEAFAFAVIMAGGEGMRLRPITDQVPKPMVEVGGVPLLEQQISRLAKAGIARIYISVNYLGDVIEGYFGDGGRLGLEIRYLREAEKLGTGGALSLLPERPEGSFIVMNGDILTTLDFGGLHAFHTAQSAVITVAAVDYRVSVPFGVIVADGPSVTSLTEKPAQRFLCNAGMYAVAPEALELLPKTPRFNMTDLISNCLLAQKAVAVFPLHEYWTDIGTPDDLAKARAFFAEKRG